MKASWKEGLWVKILVGCIVMTLLPVALCGGSTLRENPWRDRDRAVNGVEIRLRWWR